MATSLQFFIHGLPAPPDLINQRLEEAITELNTQEDHFPVLHELNQRGIKEVVVGPQHLAFLLDDGTVHRLAYTVEPDKLGSEAVEHAAFKARVGQEPPTKKSHVDPDDVLLTSSRGLTAQAALAHHTSEAMIQMRRAGARAASSGSGSSRTSSLLSTGAASAIPLPTARRSGSAPRRIFAMAASTAAVGGTAPAAPHVITNRMRPNPLIPTSAAAAPPPVAAAAAAAPPTGSGVPTLHRTQAGEVAATLRRAVAATATATSVPEELVNQVQTVLQGKSRRAVVRELLRVNLDVNMAVNNLLSRDDDDASEVDEMANENEMLINLMEDAIHNPAASDFVHESGGGHRHGAGRGVSWSTTKPGSKDQRDGRPATTSWMGLHSSAAFTFQDTVESFKFSERVDTQVPKFISIGALTSELICVSESGQLHQWRWDSEFAFADDLNPTVFHPKSAALKLLNEKVMAMAACSIRASFLTASGKLATLMDDTVDVLAKKLEHPAISFPELQNEKILDVNVCLLYSCIRVECGYLYWWGIMPLGYRHRLWEKSRTKSKKSKPAPSGAEFHVGSSVVYRNAAVYQPGAIGFRVNAWGELQCGELMDNMWDLSSVARFKLLDPKTGSPLTREAPDTKSTVLVPDTPPVEAHQASGKRASESESDGQFIIESWTPKDVIISDEGGRTPVIGKITKLSEEHAFVLFSPTETAESTSRVAVVVEETPRHMKKSDLVLFKPQGSSPSGKVPECIQKSPKKLRISAGVKKVLACALNTKSIQMVVLGVSGKLSLVNYNLQSGKKDSQSRFLCDAKYIAGRDENHVKLVTGGRDGLTIMLDGNRCFYPIEKDATGSLRVPHPLNCSPVHSISASVRSVNMTTNRPATNRYPFAAVAFVIRKASLIQSILEVDLEKVQQILESPAEELTKLLRECADGARNVLHVCAAICAPQPRKDFPRSLSSSRLDSDMRGRGDDLLELMPLDIDHTTGSPTADYINQLSRRGAFGSRRAAREMTFRLEEKRSSRHAVEIPPEGMDTLLVDARTAESSSVKPSTSATNRMDSAKTILRLLCSHPVVRKIIPELIASRNSLDMTPFMYAVLIRSYEAALVLLDTTASVVGELYADFATREVVTVAPRTVDSLVMEFLYPPGSQPDDSPLFLLCLNDVCTYTWTGSRHIQQDVWECRTCGLTGTLCCCTECARTCHRGHDCKIKRSSPTAYCDCWEKCKCKSLVSGDELFRQELFSKLVNMSTDLVIRPNSKGEFLLQYLVQTVGRQLGEQRFLKANRSDERSGDLLNPPKFCQMALTHLLGSYEALKTALMTGYPNPRLASFSSAVQEDQFHLSYQSGTALLDRFVFVLLTKCNVEHIEAFVNTVRSASGDLCDARDISIEAREMTSRFIRSIVRVFVVLTAENINGPRDKAAATGIKLQKIRDVFRKLPMSSVVELCEAAEALLAPVRLGVARSTAGFTALSAASEATRGSDDLLSMEPLAERRRGRGRRETVVTVQSNQRDVDIDASLAIPFEDDFDVVIPADDLDRRRRRTISHAVRAANTEAASAGAGLGGAAGGAVDAEPTSSVFSASTQSSQPALHDADASNMSDMDIDEDPDSDGTDSDNGHGDFAAADAMAADMEQREQSQEGKWPHSDFSYKCRCIGAVSQEPVFSEGENEDDEDNDDSEHSTGTHEEEEEDDEDDEEVESDGVDMDGGDSMEGDDDSMYPIFTMEGGRPGGAVYVRTAPSGSMLNHPRGFHATLPQGMQWAAQQHHTSRGGSGQRSSRDYFAPSARGGLVYLEPFGLVGRGRPSSGTDSSTPSFNSTFANLARSFAIIIREVTELMEELRNPNAGVRKDQTVVDRSKLDRLEQFVDGSLKKTWAWMCTIMDSTEAQLRFGYALHQSSDTVTVHPHQRERGSSALSSREYDEEGRNPHSGHLHSSHRKTARDTSAAARNDFLGYALSLMRAHNSEHGDSLPTLDVAALKHVAYVFDTLVHYIRVTSGSHRNDGDSRLLTSSEDAEMKPGNAKEALARLTGGRMQTFFRRSRSMCYLGSAQPDPFTKAMMEALPLADRPQMLLPNARREELFGIKMVDYSSEVVPVGCPASFKSPPVRLSLTNRQEDSPLWKDNADSDDEYGGEDNILPDEQMDIGESPSPGRKKILGAFITQDLVLGRWRQSLDLFSRVFADDVGAEPDSLIGDIAAFPVKEAKFRKEMERLRLPQSRDLILDVQRARADLIPESFAILNAFFNRRGSSNAALPCQKIKVTFRDEPGEGNGVARSYFTVIAEALLTQDKLPQLDRPPPPLPARQQSHGHDRDRGGVHWMGNEASTRLRFMREHMRGEQLREASNSAASAVAAASRRALADRVEAEMLVGAGGTGSGAFPDVTAPPFRPNSSSSRHFGWSPERTEMAEAIYENITHLRPSFSSSVVQRLSGMILQLDMANLELMLQNEDVLNARVDEAVQALHQQRPELAYHSPTSEMMATLVGSSPSSVNLSFSPSPLAGGKTAAAKEEEKVEEKLNDDDDPLFYEPGRPGFYALRPGKNSPARLTAFRNVGRLIGLALLQGEIFPLCLTRATVKYILGRPATWSDFAFHDPVMYETLRKLVMDVEGGMGEDELSDLCLYFAVDLPIEEGGKDFELIAFGRDVPVTRRNIYDFVRLATEARMLRVPEQALQALKRGVLDVITADTLELITADDFRLLLNGVDRAIDLQQLASWTNWQDETHDKNQDKTRFKHWFWNTVDKFTTEEKQELLYFWTGSPAMPASQAGFAPLPSVTIRPADDLHLPTANTCISRLYIPQYSSKAVMRLKLLLAIQTKNFGFV
ncbi:E3 ubiquitin-protein ligase UBR5 [Hypsibius exemplaris]|uniref:E3 ubiquitin-protein ligase UBR5 n=1 Tax=Hypsibius exemplaris TaxID=2072580 RepID=A0A9X6NFJ0_HYPEX|nr:E3 ubiquitin-protein ligase UBR5 [Hypsibius exemplaris]